MRGHTQEEHPSDRMNWKHSLEETGQSPEPTPPALVLGPAEQARAVSGQQEQGYQPRICRISEHTFIIETPGLDVGITTAGGLRVWGIEETSLSFRALAPRPRGLPEKMSAPECASVYFAVFERGARYVPAIELHRELPEGMQVWRADTWIRLDLLELPQGRSLAGAAVFIPPKR